MRTGKHIETGSNDSAPANKRLGQHWLNDQGTLSKIVDLAQLNKTDTVVEIGPGLGSLTSKLVESTNSVIAIELDESLVNKLENTLKSPNLKIYQGDILKFDFDKFPKDYKIVANIPYYLTSNLLRVLCEANNHFSRAVILVQKEVAERIAAKPGDMSLLGVSVQFYCDVELGPVVPANLFHPAPKVDSQVVILEYHKEPLFRDINKEIFFRIVKAGFSQRRKKLGNSLSAGLGIDRSDLEKLLKNDLDLSVRAQTLSLNDWYKVYLCLNRSAKPA